MKKFIELIPFGIHVIRNEGITLRDAMYVAVTRFLLEGILLLPLISSFFHKEILTIIALYSVTYLLMICVYEIFYLYNDIFAIKWEDKPTIRKYVQLISLKISIIARVLYICIFCLFILSVFHVRIEGIAISLILLILSLLIHNHQKSKINRIFTFALVRLSRLSFMPLIILYPQIHVLSYVPVITMPYFISEIVEAYRYQIKKYDIQTPKIQVPLYLLYSIFLPIQAVTLNFKLQALLGNILIIVLSLIRKFLGFHVGVIIKLVVKYLIKESYCSSNTIQRNMIRD
ncbi:MAG: hypothetical protein QXM43_01220 [Desulfurococcaceae archaeon]